MFAGRAIVALATLLDGVVNFGAVGAAGDDERAFGAIDGSVNFVAAVACGALARSITGGLPRQLLSCSPLNAVAFGRALPPPSPGSPGSPLPRGAGSPVNADARA